MHKARENANGTFSIGKTWVLDDLSAIESFSSIDTVSREEAEMQRWAGNVGFMLTIIKPYFWQVETLREREFFIASLVKIYRKYTGGKVPALVGFDDRERQQIVGASVGASGQQVDAVASAPEGRIGERQTPPPIADPLKQSLREGHVPPTLPERWQAPVQPGPSPGPPSRSYERDINPAEKESQANAGGGANGSVVNNAQSQRQFPLHSDTQTDLNVQPQDHERDLQISGADGWGTNSVAGTSYYQENMAGTRRTGTPQEDNYAVASDSGKSSDRNSSQVSLPGIELSTVGPTPTDSLKDLRTSSREQIRPQFSGGSNRPSHESQRPSSSRERTYLGEKKASMDSVRSKEDLRRQSPRPDKILVNGGRRDTPDTIETASYRSERSDRGTPPLTASTAPTAATPPPEPTSEPQEEENHRPGLGPMIKKKSGRDVASAFRKAATVYNSFKPRVGGVGDRIREEERYPKREEPDGINGVVPAPSLVRGSTNEVDVKSQARPSPSASVRISNSAGVKEQPPEVDQARRFSQDVVTAQEATYHAEEDIPKTAPTAPPTPRSLPPLSNLRGSQDIRRHKGRPDQTARWASALDIDPAVLEGKGNDIDSILSEFGWEGDGIHTKRVETLEADLRREIARAEGGSWLWQLDQKDERVATVEQLLDQAIAECDELDGLLTLYGVELSVSLPKYTYTLPPFAEARLSLSLSPYCVAAD